MNIAEELKKIVKGEVMADEASLVKYSRDASLFEVRPAVAVAPRDVEDVKALVKFASAQKQAGQAVSLTARSAGTDMTGGPLTESIVVDFTKHFNRIGEIGGDYAVTEPGVYYRDFEKETLKHGLLMPSYPASRELCTVGGMVSNNSGGEKTLLYGKTEKYVEELNIVCSDGNEYAVKPLTKAELEAKIRANTFEGNLYKQVYELIRDNFELIKKAKPNVTKNSAGYFLWNVWDSSATLGTSPSTGVFDLTKLIVGSQGTLGFVTKIKFKLIRPKEHSQMAVIFLKDLSSLTDIIRTIMAFKPESFESYDDHTLKLAMRFLPSMIKILKPKNMLKLAFQFLPDLKLFLTGGVPKLVLLAEFTGDTDEEVSRQLDAVGVKLKELKANFRLVHSKEEAKKYWVIRRESFNLLRNHISGKRTAPFIDDFTVAVERLPEFLPRLNAVLAKYDLLYTIAGHVGDANFHIIPLMDLHDPKSKEIIDKLSHETYGLVLEFKGSITAEHNDGLIRSPYLEKMYGPEVCRLFEETKRIFDPLNIFNPGKKTGSSLEYAMEHLVKS